MTPTETADILRQFNEWQRGHNTVLRHSSNELGEAIDAAIEMIERLEDAESEALEEARLNGMGSEREVALMAKLEAAERDRATFIMEIGNLCTKVEALREELSKQQSLSQAAQQLAEVAQRRADALRAKVAEMEQQEPVAAQQRFQRQQEMMAVWQPWQTTELRKGRPARAVDVSGLNVEYRELYALPGAQNVPSVPDGWKLVPIELTQEMRNAWTDNMHEAFRVSYRAMLAAAPEAKP